MELANRAKILTPSKTLAIDSKAKAMKAEGIEVFNFGTGEPDFETPAHIRAAAVEALESGFTRYTPSSGIPELRQAIADKLKKDNGIDYKASQIIVNCGAKHSCFNAILATIQEGDEVIIPAPYWLSYPEMVKLAGGEPYVVQTREENGFKLTPDELREAISPSTKMVILNTPGNPTGAVYSRQELEDLVEAALEDELLILSDEIYEKLVYDDATHHSIASFSKEAYESTITINGFSKSYAMTGWRLGYLAAPEAIARSIDSIQSHSTSNPTSFAQKGALAALKDSAASDEFLNTMLVEFKKRRHYMFERLSAVEGVSVVKPMGAFYMLVNVSGFGLSSTEFTERLLESKKVAAVPGIAFGDDKYIRLSYATSMQVISEGLEKFDEFCQSLK
ncbi:pyridoxal phosphate-dependent aminotransferase [Oscillatoria amoena NRMC-F 0135]|nr:pyridoxal phosphate-dependent aminotransferase [Oscillatoria amoena NRMC-F 0135]MDL5054509.1 pyridoxal phosphate-dependent aminotransferase [Oscillatoria laete-virens NRMC-F 0139]